MSDVLKYGLYAPDREQVVVTAEKLMTGGSISGLFNITGGPILLTACFGLITETVSNNACNTKLVMNPTTGADTDLCAVLDIAQDVVGGFWFITGLASDAMVNAVPGTTLARGMAAANGQALHPVICPVGAIDLSLANSNPTTGKATWHLRYKPLDSNTYVIGS